MFGTSTYVSDIKYGYSDSLLTLHPLVPVCEHYSVICSKYSLISSLHIDK